MNKDKCKNLKQLLQTEKEKHVKTEQQLQSLQKNSTTYKQIDSHLHDTSSKLSNITTSVTDISNNVSEVNSTVNKVLSQCRNRENTDEVTHRMFSDIVQRQINQIMLTINPLKVDKETLLL